MVVSNFLLRIYICVVSQVTLVYTLVITLSTVNPVYKCHSKEPENVAVMSSCHLYAGYNYCTISLMGKMRLPFIDSDLLYSGAL